MGNQTLILMRTISLLIGLALLGISFFTPQDQFLLKTTLQLLGSIGVVQSLILGSWKIRKIFLQTAFPRLLSPFFLALHLHLRSFVFSGIFLSFFLFLKLLLFSHFSKNISSPVQGVLFSFGLALATLWIFWWRESIQQSITKRCGVEFWRSISFSILIFTRVLFAAVGIVCTFLVLLADWLGLDPTPGWGYTRKLQFIAGLTLLLAGYLLYDRSIHVWLMRRFGRNTLKQIRHIVTFFTRAVLLVCGSVTIILVGGADFFGLDPTPGWGWPRRFQLLAGLLLVLAGIFLQNQLFSRWSYKMMGLKVLSPTQITLLIVLRLLVIASGIIVVLLVFTADFFHLDPTPGWTESRFIQLAAGIALIASGFVSHHTSLLRWQLRRLFD